MRVSLLLTLICSAAASAFGDGTVYFNNRVAGVVIAPIYGPVPGSETASRQGNGPALGVPATDPLPVGVTDYTGAARLEDADYTAELWFFGRFGWEPAPDSQRNFRTGAAVGFVEIPVTGGDVEIPGVDAGTAVTLAVRAWENLSGTADPIDDWTEAVVRNVTRGESASFNVVLGGLPLVGPALPTPNMDDFRSFSLAEPVVDPCSPDVEAPVVTLTGDPSVTIECPNLFADPGATPADNCDTTLTVIVSGSVD